MATSLALANLPVQDIQVSNRSLLQEAIHGLGITPFENAAAKIYKRAKLYRQRKTCRTFLARHPDLAEQVEWILNIMFLVGVIGTVSATITGVVGAGQASFWILGGSILSISLTIWLSVKLERLASREKTWQWKRVPFYDYPYGLPAEVKRVAGQLAAAVPGVKLEIDFLAKDTVVADPFLVASHEGDIEESFVCAWEENLIVLNRRPV